MGNSRSADLRLSSAQGVKFHDGRPLTSRDVKWTFDSLLQGKIRSTKAATYRFVDRVEAPDDGDRHLPFEGAIRHAAVEPVRWRDRNCSLRQRRGDQPPSDRLGAVPFVSAEPDKEVVWSATTNTGASKPRLERVRLPLCPMRPRGRSNCAKAAPTSPSIALPPTWWSRCSSEPSSAGLARPGNRACIPGVQPARSHLERCSRAAGAGLCDRSPPDDCNTCGEDLPGRPTACCRRKAGRTTEMSRTTTTIPNARASCWMRPAIPQVNGVRFHLTMKTSTDETTRLMVAVLQQQLREVGIALDIRTFEFATFSPTSPAERSRCTRCAGSAATKIPNFRIRFPLRQVPSQRRQPRLLLPIREWMR